MNDVVNWVLKMTVGTLAIIVIGVVTTLMISLFDHNVNNDQIFDIIGPAFNTVIGAFVGLLGGISLNRSSSPGKKNEEP